MIKAVFLKRIRLKRNGATLGVLDLDVVLDEIVKLTTSVWLFGGAVESLM